MKLVVDLLKHLANANEMSFIFGSPDFVNVEADNISYPALFFFVSRFTIDAQKANLYGASEITYFATIDIRYKSELAFTDEERIENYSSATRFLKTIIFQMSHLQSNGNETSNKYLKKFSSIAGSYNKNKFDANTDGITCDLSFVLNEAQNEICPLPFDFT